MRILSVFVCLFAAAACAETHSIGKYAAAMFFSDQQRRIMATHSAIVICLDTGAARRRLTQDSTPLQFNVTLGAVSEISADQANRIQEALNASLTAPEAAAVTVSSNTIVEDDQLTLIILVYPSSEADAATLQSELEAVGNQFTDNLRAMDIAVTSVTVNSVTPQPASQSIQRAPVTGSSLAGMSVHCGHVCCVWRREYDIQLTRLSYSHVGHCHWIASGI